ncbi:MAG: hypothetical protein ACK5NC_06440 [Vibrio sp.]
MLNFDFFAQLSTIPEFMDWAVNIIKTPYGWLVLVFVLIGIALNQNLLFFTSFWGNRKIDKITKIEHYFENERIADPAVEKVFRDLINANYFKIATGIYAEEHRRNLLIKLQNDLSHVISWVHIKRALPYIESSADNKAYIREENRMEKAGYYYNYIAGFLSLIITVSIILLFIVYNDHSLAQLFMLIVTMICGIAFTVICFYQNFPIISARKIKKELKKLKEKEKLKDQEKEK